MTKGAVPRLLVLTDDGVAPDQTAGDKVYTGSVVPTLPDNFIGNYQQRLPLY